MGSDLNASGLRTSSGVSQSEASLEPQINRGEGSTPPSSLVSETDDLGRGAVNHTTDDLTAPHQSLLKKVSDAWSKSNILDRMRIAASKYLPFLKTTAERDQEAVERDQEAVASLRQGGGPAEAFAKHSASKDWQKTEAVQKYKKELKSFCNKMMTAIEVDEGYDLVSNMSSHEEWAEIKKDIDKGDFISAKTKLEPKLKAYEKKRLDEIARGDLRATNLEAREVKIAKENVEKLTLEGLPLPTPCAKIEELKEKLEILKKERDNNLNSGEEKEKLGIEINKLELEIKVRGFEGLVYGRVPTDKGGREEFNKNLQSFRTFRTLEELMTRVQNHLTRELHGGTNVIEKKATTYEGAFNCLNEGVKLQEKALKEFREKSNVSPIGTILKTVYGKKGLKDNYLFQPEGFIRRNDHGVVQLGITKSSEDHGFSKGIYCQDSAAIFPFKGGVAVCACDGVSGDSSGGNQSEDFAKRVTEKLNQTFANRADYLASLYDETGMVTPQLEQAVKQIFVDVQIEVFNDIQQNQDYVGKDTTATTAVAFVKIERGDKNPLLIGGSIGDSCAAISRVVSDKSHQGREGFVVDSYKVETSILNPSSLDPGIHKMPPVMAIKSENVTKLTPQEEASALGQFVEKNTHVFAREVEPGDHVEVFSDGTSDNLYTTTPELNEAKQIVANMKLNSKLTKDEKEFLLGVSEDLRKTFSALPHSSELLALVKMETVLKSEGESTATDNEAIFNGFQALNKLDVEASLSAIYSNPAWNDVDVTTKKVEFNFQEGKRANAIAKVNIHGQGEAISLTPETLTPETMAKRKANFLHFVTQPLRNAQDPNYKLAEYLKKSEKDGDFEKINLKKIGIKEEEVQKLIEDLKASQQVIYGIAKEKNAENTRLPIIESALEGLRLEGEGDDMVLIVPSTARALDTKLVEGYVGAKVDDVCNAVIKV